jgi:hypothetical protein
MVYASVCWSTLSVQINRLQIYQNKLLKIITYAPWFIRNAQLHCGRQMKTIKTLFLQFATKCYKE